MQQDDYNSKNAYDFEIARKEDINNSISLPINILVGIYISIFYILDKIGGEEINLLICLNIIFVISAFILSLVASAFFAVGLLSSKTVYMDHPATLKIYREGLLKSDPETADNLYQDFIKRRYESIATINGERNDWRSNVFANGKFIVGLTLLLFAIGVSLFAIFLLSK